MRRIDSHSEILPSGMKRMAVGSFEDGLYVQETGRKTQILIGAAWLGVRVSFPMNKNQIRWLLRVLDHWLDYGELPGR